MLRNQKKPATAPLNEEMETLDGKKVNLAEKYKGKVVLLVNVASKCGNTPQYKPLEALHEKYGKEGLAIVGVPCNQFGKQEPGTATEIAEFCKKNYGVKFDMLAQGRCQRRECRAALQVPDVEGDRPEVRRQDPLELREVPVQSRRPGRRPLHARRRKPDSPEVVKAIETELAKTK